MEFWTTKAWGSRGPLTGWFVQRPCLKYPQVYCCEFGHFSKVKVKSQFSVGYDCSSAAKLKDFTSISSRLSQANLDFVRLRSSIFLASLMMGQILKEVEETPGLFVLVQLQMKMVWSDWLCLPLIWNAIVIVGLLCTNINCALSVSDTLILMQLYKLWRHL